MKKVTNTQQMLFEEKVIEEYYLELSLDNNYELAYERAMRTARGIYVGGTYLGYEYDFSSCHLRLNKLYYNQTGICK